MAELLSVSYEYIKVKMPHSFIHSCIGDGSMTTIKLQKSN
jgi:hypothetical protein